MCTAGEEIRNDTKIRLSRSRKSQQAQPEGFGYSLLRGIYLEWLSYTPRDYNALTLCY